MTIVLVVVAILAVTVVFVVISRFNAAKKQEHANILKAKRMLQAADETWDVMTSTANLVKGQDIIGAIADYYIYQVRMRDAVSKQTDTEELVQAAADFKAKAGSQKVKNALENEREISQAKSIFAKASKVLRIANSKKQLTNESCKAMRTGLKRRLLDLEVAAHERLGDKAAAKSNPAMANTHYKFAKKILIESDVSFDGKTDMIKAITKKSQELFGEAVANKLEKEAVEEESDLDEHGMPKDLDVMTGNKKLKF